MVKIICTENNGVNKTEVELSGDLDIITAQSSLLNVQLSKVADDFNKMQAVVNLYYALGGGAK